MKKILTIVLVIIVIGLSTSCKESSDRKDNNNKTKNVKKEVNNAAALVGSWKMTGIDTGEKMTEEQKKIFATMMQPMLDSSLFVFEANGKYNIKMGSDENSSGIWKISSGGKSFITKENDSEKIDTVNFSIIDGKLTIFKVENNKKLTIILEK